MTALDSLVLDLLEWIGPSGRTYGETLDTWKTSCPQLAVWEEANDLGLVTRDTTHVELSGAGFDRLRRGRGALW